MSSVEELFRAAHIDLPREAPGSEATSWLLLRLACPVPDRPRVIDIGCGTGPATLLLARTTGGQVIGVDNHEPYLNQLRSAAAEAGLSDRVDTLNVSMDAIPLADGNAELLWAEGSAYVIGFDTAIRTWRRLLVPGGALVLTEAEWTTPQPAAEAVAFWAAAYPAMRSTADNVAAAQDAGWTVAATYLLPDSDWDAYYQPLATRINQLRDQHPERATALDEVAAEIGIRAAYGRDYGYTGYVLRPR